MAERTGLEPATSGVTGQHSNQLNYRSAFNQMTQMAISQDACTATKNPAKAGFFAKRGGADGTRTRDLRRDRPAF
jgi:hypothetical protein